MCSTRCSGPGQAYSHLRGSGGGRDAQMLVADATRPHRLTTRLQREGRVLLDHAYTGRVVVVAPWLYLGSPPRTRQFRKALAAEGVAASDFSRLRIRRRGGREPSRLSQHWRRRRHHREPRRDDCGVRIARAPARNVRNPICESASRRRRQRGPAACCPAACGCGSLGRSLSELARRSYDLSHEDGCRSPRGSSRPRLDAAHSGVFLPIPCMSGVRDESGCAGRRALGAGSYWSGRDCGDADAMDGRCSRRSALRWLSFSLSVGLISRASRKARPWVLGLKG